MSTQSMRNNPAFPYAKRYFLTTLAVNFAGGLIIALIAGLGILFSPMFLLALVGIAVLAFVNIFVLFATIGEMCANMIKGEL